VPLFEPNPGDATAPVSPDPLNARSLRSHAFPESPTSKKILDLPILISGGIPPPKFNPYGRSVCRHWRQSAVELVETTAVAYVILRRRRKFSKSRVWRTVPWAGGKCPYFWKYHNSVLTHHKTIRRQPQCRKNSPICSAVSKKMPTCDRRTRGHSNLSLAERCLGKFTQNKQ